MLRSELEALDHHVLVDRQLRMESLVQLWRDTNFDSRDDQSVLRLIRAVHVDLRLLMVELLQEVRHVSEQQDQVNQAVSDLTAAEQAEAAAVSSIGTHVGNIEAEVVALQQQIASGVPSQSLDLTGLLSAVSTAKQQVTATDAVDAQAAADDPTPPAPPAPAPVDAPPADAPPADAPPAPAPDAPAPDAPAPDAPPAEPAP